jgi:hypothetical protein
MLDPPHTSHVCSRYRSTATSGPARQPRHPRFAIQSRANHNAFAASTPAPFQVLCWFLIFRTDRCGNRHYSDHDNCYSGETFSMQSVAEDKCVRPRAERACHELHRGAQSRAAYHIWPTKSQMRRRAAHSLDCRAIQRTEATSPARALKWRRREARRRDRLGRSLHSAALPD